MLINEIALRETIDNYLPGDEDKKRLIADRVFDMLKVAYGPAGGLAGFHTPEEMIRNIPMWKVVRRGNDIKAVILYKDRGGRKSVAGASDGSRQGKLELSKMMAAEFLQNRSYGEISGPTVPFLKKTLGDAFNTILVPADEVQKIFPNKNITPVGEYEYEREIDGVVRTKMLVGKPGKPITPRHGSSGISESNLTETIDNYLPGDEDKKREIAQDVYQMLQTAYAPLGGMKGDGFADPEDMVNNVPMWKVFRRGDNIKAVMLYKNKGGRKRVAIATDGSFEARREFAKMLRDEYTQRRAYSEISGPSLRFHQKLLGDELDKITLTVDQAKEVLPKEQIEAVDEYEYRRLVNGTWLNKRMVGISGKPITRRH